MTLDALYRDGVISALDYAFAQMVYRLDARRDHRVALAAALVSRATAAGDVCLDLSLACSQGIAHAEGTLRLDPALTVDQWRGSLSASPVVGTSVTNNIMILDGKRLYLQRYWKYESDLAAAIRARWFQAAPAGSPDKADNGPAPVDPDQRRAIAAALSRRFTVISGGPGTGKTYTIARIIARLQRVHGVPAERIALAAPTGKAAARLQAALEDDAAPLSAKTLHRLLGAFSSTPRFRHHRDNPLAADVVIVDEASMIDLALMAKLVDAVAPEAHLILVGDKDQLASVEAGAVLGDICRGADGLRRERPVDPVTDAAAPIVVLRSNYRFGDESGIHRLGRAVTGGDADRALSLLQDRSLTDIAWRPMRPGRQMQRALNERAERCILPLLALESSADLLDRATRFKVLAAVRKGPAGVGALNAAIERSLMEWGAAVPAAGLDGDWYHGKPVMITRNDYNRQLFNGDIGITTGSDRGGAGGMSVLFGGPRGSVRALSPEQLPPHETVYAMTVHKSQGTEFDDVVLILPEWDSPVLTRELVYTAITRARRSVEIWASEPILRTAIGRRIRRTSGLRKALWGRT